MLSRVVALRSLNVALARKPEAVVRLAIRENHHGPRGTPSMRHMNLAQHIGTYLFIAFMFLSYPTSVLLRLDSLRPKPDESLSAETLAALEEHRALRLAQPVRK